MNMKEFVEKYAENLYKTLEEHGYSIEGAGFNCCLCPMKEMCEQASANGDNDTCGLFIQKNLTDGKNFRTK